MYVYEYIFPSWYPISKTFHGPLQISVEIVYYSWVTVQQEVTF